MTSPNSFCRQCGTARQGQQRFCSSCGFDYWKAAEADATRAMSTPEPMVDDLAATATTSEGGSPPGRRWVRWAVIAVVALVAIGFVGSLLDDESGVATTSASASASASAEDATPTPDETPVTPDDEPTPDATPVTTPGPTPVPTPLATPEPEFAAIALSGIGNSVPRFDIPQGSAAIAEIAYSGASNFAVWAVDSSGAQTDLLVNTIGNYSGTVLFDELASSHTAAFSVDADGSWTITIRPVADAFHWNGAQQLAGNGDDVAILDPPSSGLKSTRVTHAGDGNFAIWAFSSSGLGRDLLVNDIGTFSGEVLLPDGTFLFEISANGPWTMSPPQ